MYHRYRLTAAMAMIRILVLISLNMPCKRNHLDHRQTTMQSRFEKVIQRAATLPVELQDEIADQCLEDIENEISWQTTLKQPQDQLLGLAV